MSIDHAMRNAIPVSLLLIGFGIVLCGSDQVLRLQSEYHSPSNQAVVAEAQYFVKGGYGFLTTVGGYRFGPGDEDSLLLAMHVRCKLKSESCDSVTGGFRLLDVGEDSESGEINDGKITLVPALGGVLISGDLEVLLEQHWDKTRPARIPATIVLRDVRAANTPHALDFLRDIHTLERFPQFDQWRKNLDETEGR